MNVFHQPFFARTFRDRCDCCHKLVADPEDCFEHEKAASLDRRYTGDRQADQAHNRASDEAHLELFSRTFCVCPIVASRAA